MIGIYSDIIFLQECKINIVGCLVVYEGMKIVSSPGTEGSLALLKESIPFRIGLLTLLSSNSADKGGWVK